MELDVDEVALNLFDGFTKIYLENIKDTALKARKPDLQVVEACDILIEYLGG